jgi:DNA segregation ATPase FtsK/SpoIIIE, S-DNA-T family
MPRGRKKKFKFKLDLNNDALKSILVVFLFLFWLISFVSFFASDYSMNARVLTFWKSLFGNTAFLAPFFLLLAATFLIDQLHVRFKQPRILFGLVVMYIALIGLAHIFVPEDRSYDIAQEGEGGGMFGYYVATSLAGSVSKYGAVAILIATFAISVIILFNLSFDQIIEKAVQVKANMAKGKADKPKAKKSEESDEASYEVTSGMPQDDEYEPVTPLENPVQKSLPITPISQDFAFEVVPSLSEPQSEDDAKDAKSVNTLINDAKPNALPYSDAIWKNPSLDLLSDYETKPDAGDSVGRKHKIVETLKSFDIDVKIEEVKTGPSVTQYALSAESGVKISKIAGLQNNMAMALESPTGSVRIEAPIPGTSFIGIEVPNNTRSVVSFKSLMLSEAMKDQKSKLAIVLGKDVSGNGFVYDIGKMPHMLIAGTTGSGKSIFIHNLIFSMLFRANPNEVKFVLIDPKRVELIHYNDIPHLVTPVVTDMSKAAALFSWLVGEMERRYVLFEKARVRNIEGYNRESGFQALNYIVVVVEELGELMQVDPNGVEKSIIRLAQLARATGIHLVLTVQRPDTKVITGLIKANIPCRVAFNVMSQIDSRVIIDQPGAEKLLGKGDMLFIPPDMSRPLRLQAAFISEKEVATLVDYLKAQGVGPNYRDDIFTSQSKAQNANTAMGSNVDELFDQAVEIVSLAGKASASLLQRKLSIGYARAARIIDELEENGIIGPSDGQKPREVFTARNNRQEPSYDDGLPMNSDMNNMQEFPS